MPLLMHKKIEPEGELGIWKIEEPELFFEDGLEFSAAEQQQVRQLRGRRRIEWLATRHLLHEMSGREVRGAVLKDAYGKPHLENSTWHISMSHSHDLAAAIASPAPVGVDVQYLVGKITRIASKFMRAEELESLEDATRIEHLHVYWGAKECLYKIYGRRELDFREHLHIAPFDYDPEGGSAKGEIIKGVFHQKLTVRYEMHGDYLLTWAVAEV